MDGVAAIATGGLLALLVGAQGLLALAHWRVQLTSPRGVMERLRRSQRRHSVRFGANRFAWNPALSVGTHNKVAGPGLAHYSLDEAGTVHLVFVSAEGDVQRLSGPAPVLPARSDGEPAARYLLGQPAVAAIGVGLGYLVSGGATGERLAIGFAAGIVGWLAAWLVIATTTSIMRTRAYVAQRD